MTYEVMREYDFWDCPFCNAKMKIKILHIPKSYSVKRAKTASLPGSKGYHKNPDIWIIQSGCSSCNKSAEEVEKKLKEEHII